MSVLIGNKSRAWLGKLSSALLRTKQQENHFVQIVLQHQPAKPKRVNNDFTGDWRGYATVMVVWGNAQDPSRVMTLSSLD